MYFFIPRKFSLYNPAVNTLTEETYRIISIPIGIIENPSNNTHYRYLHFLCYVALLELESRRKTTSILAHSFPRTLVQYCMIELWMVAYGSPTHPRP